MGWGATLGTEADRRRTAKSFVFKIENCNRFLFYIIAF